jgi:hypothetical protein
MQMLASITYVLFCRVVCTLRCYGFEIHIPCAFDCRVLSLDSLGERRGLVLNILDLKKLLGGCSQLEVGHSICLLAMELIISIVYLFIYLFFTSIVESIRSSLLFVKKYSLSSNV